MLTQTAWAPLNTDLDREQEVEKRELQKNDGWSGKLTDGQDDPDETQVYRGRRDQRLQSNPHSKDLSSGAQWPIKLRPSDEIASLSYHTPGSHVGESALEEES